MSYFLRFAAQQKPVQNVLQHLHDVGLTDLKKNPSFQNPCLMLAELVQFHYRVSYVFVDPEIPESDVLYYVKKYTHQLILSQHNQATDSF